MKIDCNKDFMIGDHTELPQVFLGKPCRFEELRDVVRCALANKAEGFSA